MTQFLSEVFFYLIAGHSYLSKINARLKFHRDEYFMQVSKCLGSNIWSRFQKKTTKNGRRLRLVNMTSEDAKVVFLLNFQSYSLL